MKQRPALLVAVVLSTLLAGCNASQDSAPTEITSSAVSSPPPRSEKSYVSDLVNVSYTFVRVLEVYLDGISEAGDEQDWDAASWNAGRLSNESVAFSAKLTADYSDAPTDAARRLYQKTLDYAQGIGGWARQIDACAAERDRRIPPADNCGDKLDRALDTYHRTDSDLRAEQARWETQ